MRSHRLVITRLIAAWAAVAVLVLCGLIGSADAAEWATHRGNAQRTGAADDQPGPKAPKVLWFHSGRESYLAPAVPGAGKLYVSSLGAFNTSRFDALSTELVTDKRTVWAKSAPYLKLPTAGAPALAAGLLVFGDGMHQTDGAILHCLSAEDGLPVWQFPVPGKLVHLEGAPTVANGKVYIGGGHAGVLCVDLNRVSLEGKEQDLATVQKDLAGRWKVLLAKFEADKKKDPDFAVPPNEDSLPKPVPAKIWQQGANQWHVDAAVAVADDRVFVASAFLNEEKEGERALLSLAAGDGQTRWKAPLKLNPWAGPTLAEGLVLVGCSSIRFDPKLVAKAQGEVVALDVATGKVKWRKPIGGGVVSAIAVRDKLAVFTATDGKVRAFDTKYGAEKWSYDLKAPCFAGVAASGDAVYTADLKGVVHAVKLADGEPLWTLNLAGETEGKVAGMVFGAPTLQQGKLYIATCNLEGNATQPCGVVCLGDR